MPNNNEFEIDISLAESDKKLKKEIEKTVCALFNSNGGKLIVTAGKDGYKIDVDKKIRPCEQYFQGVIGTKYVQQYFKISVENDSRVVLDVSALPILCTLCTNLRLPTNTETPFLPPIEQDELRKILFERRVVETSEQEIPEQFLYGNKLNIFQSKTVQFKKPGNKADKDFASRAIKSNFTHFVSRFANGSGGMIYYGINDDGTVVGELLSDEEKDRQEITEKLEKAVEKMIWADKLSKLVRGKQWDIKFVPVKNCEECENRFVIVVSVSPCSGGVFIQEPESYYVENGEVKKMPFEIWMEKAWQLERWKTIEIDFSKILEKTQDINAKLICLLQMVAINYHQSQFGIAQSYLEQFWETMLKTDNFVCESEAQSSTPENQPLSSEYPKPSFTIKDGSLKSDNGPAEFILRPYYHHAASVLVELVKNESPIGKNKDDKDFQGHVGRAKDLCDKALQDLMNLNDDCELGQRINIMLALLYLKSAIEDLASNSEVPTAAEVKIKESEECVKNLERSGTPFIDNNHSLLLLAKSELHSEIAKRCVKKTAELANADGFEEIKLQCEHLEKGLKLHDVKH